MRAPGTPTVWLTTEDQAARALIVNALREKAGNDREAAAEVPADPLAQFLREQADRCDQLADDLEV